MSKQEISIYISKVFFFFVVDVLVFGFAFEKKISNLSKLKKERERNRLDIIYSGFSKTFDKMTLGEIVMASVADMLKHTDSVNLYEGDISEK